MVIGRFHSVKGAANNVLSERNQHFAEWGFQRCNMCVCLECFANHFGDPSYYVIRAPNSNEKKLTFDSIFLRLSGIETLLDIYFIVHRYTH